MEFEIVTVSDEVCFVVTEEIEIDGQTGLHKHLVPISAIASWGELLGVADEQALAAILARTEPPAEDDRGPWAPLYEALTEVVQTEAQVQVVEAEGMQALDADEVSSQFVSLMAVSGPEILVAQTAALAEDTQRTAVAAMDIPPEPEAAPLDQVADLIAQRRQAFRDSLTPATILAAQAVD